MDKRATRDGFGKAIEDIGSDEKIIVLAAGTGDSTRAHKFRAKFPERYIECGISEQNMIGMAAGVSLDNRIPIATTFAAFLPGRCFDQIRQSVCYSNLNVKLAATHAGLTVGPDGATHQMMEDIAMLRALPNMTIIVPCDANEAEAATKAMIKHTGPVYLRLGRPKVDVITAADETFKIGISKKLNQGDDCTIISCGYMVGESIKACKSLEKEGIRCRLINMHTIKPIDKEAIIKAAKETGCIVTAEEHQKAGGLGSAVAEALAEALPTPLIRVGMDDSFGESGKPEELMDKYGLTAKAISDAARMVMKKKRL